MSVLTKTLGVAIGGSAGSLDGVHDMFAAIPPTVDAVFLLVIHISPGVESLLPSVVGAYTQMAVVEAVDKLPLAPRTVIVAPPDYHLLVERDFTVALSRDRVEHFSRPAIDPLFDTAALAFGRRGVGVLLSGSNPDGAGGLAAIHAAGGKTIVQSPASASSPEMPQAALDLFMPDLVATPSAIGRWLATYLGGSP
jgi:two-component system chemotaxis response regulator CheB